jgi:hypothetical protein
MLESVLDSAREAVCIISAEGRLDLMSPLTREWLTQGVHLRVRRNALQHADQSAHQRYLATVGAVPGNGTPRWTVLPGKWGETYRIRIARAPHTVGMSVGPRAILRIERRDIFSVPDETILRETFGLTLAEGRVFPSTDCRSRCGRMCRCASRCHRHGPQADCLGPE